MEKVSKHSLKREATRTQLLALGTERFPVKGFSATTIEDVVRDSGLTRGAFYFHFASKEEFFLEVMRSHNEQRHAWWEVAEDERHTTLEAAAIAAFTVLNGENGRGGSAHGSWIMLIADFYQSVSGDEELMRPLRELYEDWVQEIGRFVAIVQRRGLARTDETPRDLGAMMLSAVNGFTVGAAVYGESERPVPDILIRILRP